MPCWARQPRPHWTVVASMHKKQAAARGCLTRLIRCSLARYRHYPLGPGVTTRAADDCQSSATLTASYVSSLIAGRMQPREEKKAVCASFLLFDGCFASMPSELFIPRLVMCGKRATLAILPFTDSLPHSPSPTVRSTYKRQIRLIAASEQPARLGREYQYSIRHALHWPMIITHAAEFLLQKPMGTLQLGDRGSVAPSTDLLSS